MLGKRPSNRCVDVEKKHTDCVNEMLASGRIPVSCQMFRMLFMLRGTSFLSAGVSLSASQIQHGTVSMIKLIWKCAREDF